MISVIIPLYNKEAIIERSLNSVLSQDYNDFEVVIVDDGSTDRSAEIVLSIKDNRIRFYSQENGGPSKARNTGLRHANGEWIVFLDADDELLPGALFHFADLTSIYPNDQFFCCPFCYNSVRFGKGREFFYPDTLITKPFIAHFFRLIFPRTGACLYSKSLVLKCMFDEGIRRYEDVDFMFRLYRSSFIRLDSTPVMMMNNLCSSASQKRKNVMEDYIGHIVLDNKSFWEKLCNYSLFIGERVNYPELKNFLPDLFKRYDLYILYQVLQNLGNSKIILSFFFYILNMRKMKVCIYNNKKVLK